MNPYLPFSEYIPDGEPHLFDGRVYVYGSHDRFGGNAYCLLDYVCYSAPEDDLTSWRYEGVIYEKTQDPENKDGRMCLYAPDVTKGSDGRYYLYYVLDKVSVVSVAVCDTPAGKYEFYGYVHYSDGVRLGEGETDEAQFDPAVITEGNVTYLYGGFCMPDNKDRHGAMVTVLGRDMLTVLDGPQFVLPSKTNSKGTVFEDHEYFEAPSIRKIDNLYYLVYSSVVQHELCYATSESPVEHFKYRGVIVSNNDIGIGTYKPPVKPAAYGANNHGGIVRTKLGDHIFYHRHTNGTNFSRQGCIERIEIEPDGRIEQVEITSEGVEVGHLRGKGVYPAYIACNLFTHEDCAYTGAPGTFLGPEYPRITQDFTDEKGEEGSKTSYITNMVNGATAGYKYFDIKGVTQISVWVRGYTTGEVRVRTSYDGPAIGSARVDFQNIWTRYDIKCDIGEGVYPLYFEYKGDGALQFLKFELKGR